MCQTVIGPFGPGRPGATCAVLSACVRVLQLTSRSGSYHPCAPKAPLIVIAFCSVGHWSSRGFAQASCALCFSCADSYGRWRVVPMCCSCLSRHGVSIASDPGKGRRHALAGVGPCGPTCLAGCVCNVVCTRSRRALHDQVRLYQPCAPSGAVSVVVLYLVGHCSWRELRRLPALAVGCAGRMVYGVWCRCVVRARPVRSVGCKRLGRYAPVPMASGATCYGMGVSGTCLPVLEGVSHPRE